uniref:Uncharacterized protein n=1 Tax=Arundo donax TaxID=35708 RepID=A0A0A9EXS8_ARUDO
MSNLWKREDC